MKKEKSNESNVTSNSYQFKELIEKMKKENYYNSLRQMGITDSSETYEEWKEKNKLGTKYISDEVIAPKQIKSMDGKRIATVGGLKLITNFGKLLKDINATYNRKLIPEETDIIVSSNIYYKDFIENIDVNTWEKVKTNYPNLLIIRESEFLKMLGFKVPKSECKGENTIDSLVDYTVIDLETTGINAKTCEIIEMSAVKVRNGEIIDKYTTLIKPNVKISPKITEITGITNEMLENAPKINDKLQEYFDFIGYDVVLGHNIASYDVPILRRYCEELNLGLFSNDIFDTLKFARKCDINVTDNKLTTLTEYFKIEHVNAHRALSDCVANHECYQRLKEFYNPNLCTKRKPVSPHKHYANFSDETRQLQELSCMISEIISDNALTDLEIESLNCWLNQNQHLSGNYPFDKVNSAIRLVLKDGIITDEEKSYLLNVLSDFNNPIESCSANIDKLNLRDKQVVLTGNFVNGSKDEITSKLEMLGASVKNSVSGKTDYVIVGGYGSNDWACGNYGSKVKKALELQSKGKDIKIIKEEEFFKCLKETV